MFVKESIILLRFSSENRKPFTDFLDYTGAMLLVDNSFSFSDSFMIILEKRIFLGKAHIPWKSACSLFLFSYLLFFTFRSWVLLLFFNTVIIFIPLSNVIYSIKLFFKLHIVHGTFFILSNLLTLSGINNWFSRCFFHHGTPFVFV